MGFESVRKGITNANFNEENSNILFGEFAIISIAVGVGFQSWWWGGIILFGLFIALAIKPIAIILMLILSICWGIIGCGIGSLFESTGAMVVLSLLGFVCGAGAHFSALEWTNDIGS